MIKKINNYLKQSTILLLTLIILCGCWDFEDINIKTIIISVGVDSEDKDTIFVGEAAKLQVLRQQEERISATNTFYYQSQGKNYEKANLNATQKFPFPVFLGATRIVVFGENFAKEGIEAYIHRIDSIYDYRKTLIVAISRDPIHKLFQLEIDNDVAVGFFIEDSIIFLETRGKAIKTNVGEIITTLNRKNKSFLLPYIGIEGDEPIYLGLAIMKNGKQLDVIDIDELDGVTFVIGESPTYIKTYIIPGEEGNIHSFIIDIDNRKIDVNYNGEKLTIKVNLDLYAQMQYKYYSSPLENKERKEIEATISKNISKEIKDVINRSQKEYKCDFFGFSEYFRIKYPKTLHKVNWEELYSTADVVVNVNTSFINENLNDYNAKSLEE